MAPHLDGPPSTCDLSAQVLASVWTRVVKSMNGEIFPSQGASLKITLHLLEIKVSIVLCVLPDQQPKTQGRYI